jgi:hypothetical protein
VAGEKHDWLNRNMTLQKDMCVSVCTETFRRRLLRHRHMNTQISVLGLSALTDIENRSLLNTVTNHTSHIVCSIFILHVLLNVFFRKKRRVWNEK